MRQFKAIRVNELVSLTCDGCGQQACINDLDFYEFISINHQCGYSSLHGDGNQISVDLCQQCFAEMCGDALNVIILPDDKSDWDSYFDEPSEVSDDFMNDRANIATEHPNENLGNARGILSNTPINPNIDDDDSRQSAIDDENDI